MPTDENELPQDPSPASTAEPASPPVETPDAAADAAREAALAKVQEDLKVGNLGDEPPAPPAQDKAPEKPAPAADTTAPPEVDPEAAYDDPDDVREDEVDPKFTKIRERIQKTRGSLREARKQLAQHESHRSITKQAGFTDEAHEEWIMLGARANLGDPEAIAELGQRLLRAGFQVQPPPTEADEDAAIEAEAEAIYEAKFAAKVKAYKMDEDAARELAMEMAEAKAPAPAPRQAPAPSQPQSQIPPQPAPAGPDPITRAALGTIQQTNAAYAKTLPNWKDVEALATELVHKDRARGVQLHPLKWLADWQTKVRMAQVHLARSAVPAPAVQVRDTGMRPGRGAGTPPGGADPRSARMADIQAALASGNLDALP